MKVNAFYGARAVKIKVDKSWDQLEKTTLDNGTRIDSIVGFDAGIIKSISETDGDHVRVLIGNDEYRMLASQVAD